MNINYKRNQYCWPWVEATISREDTTIKYDVSDRNIPEEIDMLITALGDLYSYSTLSENDLFDKLNNYIGFNTVGYLEENSDN